MPLDNLHLTALEIAHSSTEVEIQKLVDTMNSKVDQITDYTLTHHPRLVKPMLSYDSAAVALCFLPADGESATLHGDCYTYHHLRRDLYSLCTSTDIRIASRYTVPSSHITIARFVTKEDFSSGSEGNIFLDHGMMRRWVETLESVNAWIQEEYWPQDDYNTKEGGEWVVGQEKGLDCRKGTLWYGGGETVRLGGGF